MSEVNGFAVVMLLVVGVLGLTAALFLYDWIKSKFPRGK